MEGWDEQLVCPPPPGWHNDPWGIYGWFWWHGVHDVHDDDNSASASFSSNVTPCWCWGWSWERSWETSGLVWWTSEVVNVWGGERLILHRGWWTSEVVNVWGGECLGGERLTIGFFSLSLSLSLTLPNFPFPEFPDTKFFSSYRPSQLPTTPAVLQKVARKMFICQTVVITGEKRLPALRPDQILTLSLCSFQVKHLFNI